MNTKLIGTLMRALGCGLLFAAYMMDTSVETGSGAVYNIGLLSQQSNLSILGALSLIAGIFIYVLENKKSKNDLTESDLNSNELKKLRLAGEDLYVQSGQKADDRITRLDLTIFWIPLILAAFFYESSWLICGFLILGSLLFLGYKNSFYKKQIIEEMKAKGIEPTKGSEDL